MPESNRLGDRETQKRLPASKINLGPQRNAPSPETRVARSAAIPAWMHREHPLQRSEPKDDPEASIPHVQTTSDALLAKRVDSLKVRLERAGFEARASQRRRPDVIGNFDSARTPRQGAARTTPIRRTVTASATACRWTD